MKLIPLLLLFAFISPAKCADSTKVEESLNVHIMPLSLIHIQPRYRIGLEYVRGDWGYILDIGFANGTSIVWYYPYRDIDVSYRVIEFRPELKYYIIKSSVANFYTSGELFYTYSSENLTHSYYTSNGSTFKYDKAKVHKHLYGSHFKIGLSSTLSEHLDIDMYFGAGYARRLFNYSNVINREFTEGFFEEEWFPQNYRHEGTSNVIHFTFGCKLGYNF